MKLQLFLVVSCFLALEREGSAWESVRVMAKVDFSVRQIPSFGEGGERRQSAMMKADSPTVFLKVGENSYGCETFQGLLCQAYVPDGTRAVRIEIFVLGYKKYSVNVPISTTDKRSGGAEVDIGTVKLLPADLPKVEQIVLSRTDSGASRFRITIHNAGEQAVFIKKVVVAVRTGWPSTISCAKSEPRYFKITDHIRVVGGGTVKRIAGTFVDDSIGKEYVVDAIGELKADKCDHYALVMLSMPVSLELPPKEYSPVDIEVPPQFVVGLPAREKAGPTISYRDVRTNLRGGPFANPSADVGSMVRPSDVLILVSASDLYDFHFYPSKEGEGEIDAEYHR